MPEHPNYPTHLHSDLPAIEVRRGSFWIPGERVDTSRGPVQVGPMHVEWESLPDAAGVPVVLIHGGGGQATDWKTTPDGRPGWADRWARAGHPVYLVDRPGHGRSPAHPDVVGPLGAPGGYGSTGFVFVPRDADTHTQWPWGREPGDYAVDQLTASAGFLPQDIAIGQRRDADRLIDLLRAIGPAVLLSHSAGAPAGWLALMEHPELVLAVVAIEPMGPPYAEIPGIGRLAHGLTAAEPAVAEEIARTNIGHAPIAVVTGETSVFVPASHRVAEHLRDRGASVTGIDLPERGIRGNGHGLFFEANSDAAFAEVLEWVRQEVPTAG